MTPINGTPADEMKAAKRILADLTGSAATASATDTEAMIKSIIGQVQMKTAEFVQAVIAEAGIEKAASVKTVKQLIAKWAKAGQKPTALVPTCKFVAQDLPPKPDKPKGTKKAATPKEKAPAKPRAKKYKAPPMDTEAMASLFPGHFTPPPAKVAKKGKGTPKLAKGKLPAASEHTKFQLYAVPLMVARSVKVSHSGLNKPDLADRAQAYTEMRLAA